MVIRVNLKIAAAVLLAFVLLLAAVIFGKNAQAIAPGDSRIPVPILMYHEIKNKNLCATAISPYEFELDLQYLRSAGYTTVFMSDLIAYVNEGIKLPERPIVISFDDGYLNNYVYAYPLLKKYQMKAVLSIIGKDADNFTKTPDKNLEYAHCDWTELREMEKSGCFEIQNHTYDMHTITYKRYGCAKNVAESEEHYETALVGDLTRCQGAIEENLGAVPTTFTYPYGKVSTDSLAVVRNLGFSASLSCRYGINLLSRDPDCLYCMMRISRVHGTTAKKTISEAMKTLKYDK